MQSGVTCQTCEVNTLRRPTARIILVAGLLLLGACGGSGGSGGAKTTTTKAKPATTTTKPGKVVRPVVARYCAKVKANKVKYTLQTRASSAIAGAYAASLVKIGPPPIAQALKVWAAAINRLAASPTDGVFKLRRVGFAKPEVKNALGRIVYYNVRACKITS